MKTPCTIYVVRGTMGATLSAHLKKKDAIAANAKNRAWHLRETSGIFDGVEEVELQ